MTPMTHYRLILFVALFFVVFDNYPLFSHTLQYYPLGGFNLLYVVSLGVLLCSFIVLLFSLFASKYTTKPLLIVTLLVSSFTTYFMNTYNVVIDDSMIRNALQTDIAESADLVSFKLFFYLFFLGVIPAFLVYKVELLEYETARKSLAARGKAVVLSLVVIAVVVFSFSKFYTSFFREHKVLRFYSNPTYWIYSIGWYTQDILKNKNKTFKTIGEDAVIADTTTKKLVIMVVGEAARADHFSLNGYTQQTNPKLAKEDIINFNHMYSCGTSTAYSVPCMFSLYNRDNYTYQKAQYSENVLDVLQHTDKVAILWRDNNSDSKGVALRVQYEDYKTPKNNPTCDTECRDAGMLVGLDTFIQEHNDKHILIVLHQMGNHGPAYYKRYTKEYEKFTPTCTTNQLEQCSKATINNAYDNALLYTDDFLAKTLAFAKKYPNKKVAVVYMADHGESLGENGIYLHGLPYFIAPDAQIHIGSFLWLNPFFSQEINPEAIQRKSGENFSHDNLFHTLLGLFGVKTKLYKSELDISALGRDKTLQ